MKTCPLCDQSLVPNELPRRSRKQTNRKLALCLHLVNDHKLKHCPCGSRWLRDALEGWEKHFKTLRNTEEIQSHLKFHALKLGMERERTQGRARLGQLHGRSKAMETESERLEHRSSTPKRENVLLQADGNGISRSG